MRRASFYDLTDILRLVATYPTFVAGSDGNDSSNVLHWLRQDLVFVDVDCVFVLNALTPTTWNIHPLVASNAPQSAVEYYQALEFILKQETKIHKLVAFCPSDNPRVESYFKKLGFYCEGHLKHNLYRNNQYVDQTIYSKELF